ncbi:baseplate assembly protein [Intestinimonas sp. UBA1698]|uniref:baseplate assembly protein n=1 Tax=Intestinimonas sp. UBA1698 TaxID=1946651 RepID=UPI00257E93C5|nr:baseplate J/gp47 family protein [Intestinimonas sp. UBA1698]
MPDFSAVKNAPDISFIDNKTIEDVRDEMVADYEEYMTKATGQTVTLPRSSPHRGILYATGLQVYQAFQYIDRAGKQSLLKYSYSDFLDNLGLLKGVTRSPATAAVTTLRFTISAVRQVATAIPKGTRVSAGGSVYFATDEYAEIQAGSSTVDVPATCTDAGTEGNDLAAGDLTTMVDPLPYVASVTNTTATEGGADVESDDDLAERIFLAPGAYSTAGPEDGYLFHAKQFNPSIGDVVATSNQAAGTVDIVFIMADGKTPGTEMINGLKEYLSGKTRRPMTDLVNVSAPAEVTYTVDLTYYINRSDSARAVAIQEAVQTAVADYLTWQRTIGRDINPSKLVALVMAAGAKRVTVTAPTYTTVDAIKVSALSGTPTISYGGLEDD